MTTLALIAAGAGSAGGLTAFFAKKLHGSKQPKPRDANGERPQPAPQEEPR